ncbi:hypothetical protein AB0878_36715 [Amycolatopsis sp. NPDC047767]|uniref:hypothetical protein n=1 Tax=Amycolatopsis sp. NPDC047767 TaxID=3156765 RepID=UPI0034526843
MRWRHRATSVGLAQGEPDRRAPWAGPIPSKLAGFDFEVRCTVVWNAPPGWREKARRAVAAHATKLLGNYSPVHADLAETRLAADLAVGCTLSDDPPIRVWAEDVAVAVDPDQFELARQHAQRLREREIATAGHEVERAEIEYLKNTVFKDTASAALWWLRRHDHDVLGLNSVVPDLEHTVKIIAGAGDQDPVGTLVTAFDALVPDLGRNERYEIHQQLAQILAALGRNGEADALLSRVIERSADDSA